VNEAELERRFDLAEQALDDGDLAAAQRLLDDLLLQGDALDPSDRAEAHYLLGLICEERDDRVGTTSHWLEVLRLDACGDPPQPLLPDAEFERLAQAALDELPQALLDRLGNIPVLIEDRPSPEMVRDGVDPRLLGIFSGPAMPDESVLGGGAAGVIQLYQRNLESAAGDEAELAEQIRITVLHETAHYFGASEDRLRAWGLD
jgi:predicted Zn-dependent protease with MMP-like domain